MDDHAKRHLTVLPPDGLTRDQRRSRRPRLVRSKTLNVRRLTLAELREGRAQAELEQKLGMELPERPTKRGECEGGERPCPFVSCAHHLYLDVRKNGSITLNFPDLEVDELRETCALDVAERGGAPLERVGSLMNLTRERVRQVEVEGKRKVHDSGRAARRLREMLGLESRGGATG